MEPERDKRIGRRVTLGAIAAGLLGVGYVGVKSGHVGRFIDRDVLGPIGMFRSWNEAGKSDSITPWLDNNTLWVTCVYLTTNRKNKAYILTYKGDSEGSEYEIPHRGLPLEGILSRRDRFKLYVKTQDGRTIGREMWYHWRENGGLEWSKRDLSKDTDRGFLDIPINF